MQGGLLSTTIGVYGMIVFEKIVPPHLLYNLLYAQTFDKASNQKNFRQHNSHCSVGAEIRWLVEVTCPTNFTFFIWNFVFNVAFFWSQSFVGLLCLWYGAYRL